MTFELGSEVRDKMSGITGIVTGRAEYLFTTPTVQLTPKGLGNDGKPMGALWLEEAQVEAVPPKLAAGYVTAEIKS